jgi:cobalt transporter subunit CbtB
MREMRTAQARTLAAVEPAHLAALAAILLGAFLVFGAGFAGSAALHEAAHDGRHAFAFPCH